MYGDKHFLFFFGKRARQAKKADKKIRFRFSVWMKSVNFLEGSYLLMMKTVLYSTKKMNVLFHTVRTVRTSDIFYEIL